MNRKTIKRQLDTLARLDADLARAIEQVGYPEPRVREPGFGTFVSTLVSQQISTSAAAAIMGRLHELLPSMEPAALLGLPDGALHAAGLSTPKIGYLEALARAMTEGRFEPRELAGFDDAAAIAAITAQRGFGIWSAEIYLMFSLGREDVFPAGDLALRTGLQRLRGIDEKLSEMRARELAQHWAPYRSAASLFLWHYYRGAPT